jgi:uncharacterized protein (TIGR02145 family)
MKKRYGYPALICAGSLILMILSGGLPAVKAQDYLINFSAMGAGTVVSTVKIENLTLGTTLTINGSDVLHLVNSTIGIQDLGQDQESQITFSPNPMKEYSRMEFYLPVAGETTIDIFDISGRKILHARDFLTDGHQMYMIHDLVKGIYFARVISGRLSISGRLLSSNTVGRDAGIEFEQTSVALDAEKQKSLSPKNVTSSEGIAAEVQMQYNSGDILKLTGSFYSSLSTVVIDVPTSSKTIQFKFMECTDGEFNYYPVVKIGTQTWMASNLKTTKYNDLSTAIPLVTDNAVWGSLTTPAYCWYNNDATTFKVTYGALYNWYAVNTGNICPSGWHVPSDAEFTTLTTFIDGNAGGKLKETSTVHWTSPNTGATNEYGFTALPGGDRGGTNWGFQNLGNRGSWYSSTAEGTYNALGRVLEYNYGNVATLHAGKSVGSSVRCIRDVAVPPGGEWASNSSIGAIVFAVDPSGTKITRVNYQFTSLQCGPVTISGGLTFYQTPPWSVTGGNFSISNTLDTYGYEVFTLAGSYDQVNQKYTGTWTFYSHGSTCTGNWEAFLLN